MGTGGKGSKFAFFFLQYGGSTVARIYLTIVGQDKDLLGYGLDYLSEIGQ